MGQEGNRAGGNHRVAEGSIRNLKASGNVALIILSRLPFLSIMPSYSFLLILSVQDFHVWLQYPSLSRAQPFPLLSHSKH